MVLKPYPCVPYKSIPTHLGEQVKTKRKKKKENANKNNDSEITQLKIRLGENHESGVFFFKKILHALSI